MKLKKNMSGNKNIFVLLFIIFSFKAFCQEYRVMYNYTFVSDSTKIDVFENEEMILDVNSKGSVFYSYDKYRFDSIAIEKSKRRENILTGDNSKISYFIEKKYPKLDLIYHTNLGYTNYAVLDNPIFDWKLEPVKKTIKGIEVQKATLDFGNRNWIAWYAKDIPIFDGPYKFSGLPGLIIEIEDIKNQHKFQFIGLERNYDGYEEFFKTKKIKEQKMNNEEFKNEWERFKKDPARDLKFNIYNSKHGIKINYDGKDYSTSEMIKYQEEKEREKIKRNNNFLELTLYK